MAPEYQILSPLTRLLLFKNNAEFENDASSIHEDVKL